MEEVNELSSALQKSYRDAAPKSNRECPLCGRTPLQVFGLDDVMHLAAHLLLEVRHVLLVLSGNGRVWVSGADGLSVALCSSTNMSVTCGVLRIEGPDNI